jgi:hypothetical protein
MRVLIPVAGEDRFFPPSEYHFPKPLVEISGEPMIVRVIENLRTISPDAEFIFVIPEEQHRAFGLGDTLLMATSPMPVSALGVTSPSFRWTSRQRVPPAPCCSDARTWETAR